ncbi:MAG: CotH kinase family protein [Bacteroidales bacterium]|nr:CotH kinase family protein [Bacteroidales bacterium]
MKKLCTNIILLLVLLVPSKGQTLTDSNLPIVIITTDGGATIPDEPKVKATMKLIDRGPGQRNYVSDQYNAAYLNYNGRIGIELRGSSSQESPKKNYGFTTRMADDVTNNNVSLLGMPEENDWILGGMVFDTALVRDYLCHKLYGRLGNYASRAVYCEVIINNDYMGLYMLQEKLKADENRIDVIKIKATDNTLPGLSGGYITKADKLTGGDTRAWIMYSFQNSIVEYIHELPKPEDATSAQTGYIKDEFFRLETAAKNNDVSVITGYPAIIDIPSFIDYMIINEFASNPDAYQYSTFFHKDRNSKLRAGPLWDIDLSFGNDLFQWYLDRSKTYLWYFEDYYYNNGSRFWRDLFYNTQYKCYLSRRWNELIQPGQTLSQAALIALIDSTVSHISEAVTREYQRWGKIGSHSQRIADIKSFMSARTDWITSNIGPYSACSNVSVPQLTITKIMYHPLGTMQFPDEDELEFLEIRNTGSTPVNLSGIYFRGTGFVYQFPANATLGAGLCVIIASNATVFQSRYGFAPFGEFTRQLSNSGEKLVLSDAFGNLVDYVEYTDGSPWPDADGNGYYLMLAGMTLDNSLPESWTVSNDLITSTDTPAAGINFTIYPNPVRGILNISSETEISGISIYDIRGNRIMVLKCNDSLCNADVSSLVSGTYIVRVFTAAGSQAVKFVKE